MLYISLEQLYWLLEYGRARKKLSLDDLRVHMDELNRPVFFISTGRCGTKWLASLLKKDKSVKVFHAPQNDLALQNKFAYQIQKEYDIKRYHELKSCLSEIFLAGRAQYLRYSYKAHKRYFETNNHLTFFAPTIAEMIPDALFVHITRHPLEFVQSGLKRNWYKYMETNRQIVPTHGERKNLNWEKINRESKILWLWNETNEYIEKFKSSLSREKHYTFNFNHLAIEPIMDLTEFLDISISRKSVNRLLKTKINASVNHSANSINLFTSSFDKDILHSTAKLADLYNYNL